jgi:GcrA cell cycle regulator
MPAWTPEMDAALTRHWLNGLSLAQIAGRLADDLGVSLSRNAVLGRKHRLHLPDRIQPKIKVKTSKLPGASKPRPAQKAPSPAAKDPHPDAIPWKSRPRDGCQWIYGEPGADALCCGKPCLPERAWCADHAALAYSQRSAA